MILNKLKTIAQLLGYIGLTLLAVQGLLSISNGETVWASINKAKLAMAAEPPVVPRSAALLQNDDTPSAINYRGTLQGGDGNPLDGVYTMTFRLYDDIIAPTNGNKYEKVLPGVSVRNGNFSVTLEDIDPDSFSSPNRFIGVTVDPYEEMVPRQRFVSVPYAFSANRAFALSAPGENHQNMINADGFIKVGDVGVGQVSDLGSPRGNAVYANLGSNNHGTVLLASNLYMDNGSDNLKVANDHPTMAGAAIQIPGNGQPRQNYIEFWTAPTGSVTSGSDYTPTTPRMVIDPSGNVGIGTTTPGHLLDVQDRIRVRQGDTGSAGIWLFQTGTNSDRGFVGMENDNHVGFWGAQSSWGMVMDVTNGNVGIGTTEPHATLDVNGDFTLKGMPPIRIKRFTHVGENARAVDTGISADDYYCVAGGWWVHYDIRESEKDSYMVWTYVSGPTWQVAADFGNEKDDHDENPDVDIICFRKEIASWEGEPVTVAP